MHDFCISHLEDYVNWLENYIEKKAKEAEEKRQRDELTSHQLVKMIWQIEEE